MARGLLKDDSEWDRCLQEAGLIQTGHQLRQLFVSILIYNNPIDARSLYDRHLESLSDDCRHRLQIQFHIINPDPQQVESLALQEINFVLQRFGKSLADYSLPNPIYMFDDNVMKGVPRIISEQKIDDPSILQERWRQGYRSANQEQKMILDTIRSMIISRQSGLFFIDGPGGTGKTFVENLLLNWVRANSEIALAVASSGIASILLHHGVISHSRFHIPIDIQAESICNISLQSPVAQLLRCTKLIVWDEVSSQSRYCFEAVDRTLKDINKSPEWFGGIPIVFAGIIIIYRRYFILMDN